MNIQVDDLQWTWDIEKAKTNLEKHGVSFELAERALGDPFCISISDPHPDEERWRSLGSPSADEVVVLFVVHTWPLDEEGVGRIISARRAVSHERRAYEERES